MTVDALHYFFNKKFIHCLSGYRKDALHCSTGEISDVAEDVFVGTSTSGDGCFADLGADSIVLPGCA